MPVANPYQKIAVLPIDANLKTTIETKLNEGYYIQFVAVLPNNQMMFIYTVPEFPDIVT